ncbi:hypothetical protein PAXRUDRAFT_146546 [Paxillus rubicundulus Ve08.2h10]|uniref:Secreted protein n=1 Tax=Paxillus rubicundulus Ve08.2h10 TaxID=930991 RepID=A0A0D0DMF2_9AGAM|nr:hypothetical protein PAXRUDRAFT_146546 [Paxillus rubicundulus Ve08.2h10]
MKTFLTLLAAITSFSAYTLVGVHGKCPISPTSLDGMGLRNQCTVGGITACQRVSLPLVVSPKTLLNNKPILILSFNMHVPGT